MKMPRPSGLQQGVILKAVTQRAQYPLIKEDGITHNMQPEII